MSDIADKSIDMILCDLPYAKTACKWDKIIPVDILWEQYKRVIKNNGAIVLTAQQPFASMLISSNLKWFKYEWIWNKQIGNGFVLAKVKPLAIHENILIFCNGTLLYNPQMTKTPLDKKRKVSNKSSWKCGKTLSTKSGMTKPSLNYNPDLRFPTTLLTYNSKLNECNPVCRIHPTQKPVALFEYLIKTYTNEKDIVLDNCAGSFTTAIA